MALTMQSSAPAIFTTSDTNILSLLSPAFTHSIYLAVILQRLLSTTTLFLLFRAYFLSAMILRQSFYVSQILLLKSHYTSCLVSRQLFIVSKHGMKTGWKATENFRNRLLFEFMVWILGGGNSVILVVFWPGWIVIGGGLFGVLWACG